MNYSVLQKKKKLLVNPYHRIKRKGTKVSEDSHILLLLGFTYTLGKFSGESQRTVSCSGTALVEWYPMHSVGHFKVATNTLLGKTFGGLDMWGIIAINTSCHTYFVHIICQKVQKSKKNMNISVSPQANDQPHQFN